MHCFRNIKKRGSVSRETLPRFCLYTIRLKNYAYFNTDS